MNHQLMEQMNGSLVLKDDKWMNNNLTNSKHMITSDSSKSSEELLINNSVLQSTNKRLVNGQKIAANKEINLKSKNENRLTNYNSPISYQNDNSVYYTPAHKVQNSAANHKSPVKSRLKKAKRNQNMNNLDCSFDDSIVPVASSSTNSERSSLNLTNLCSENNADTIISDYKKSKNENKQSEQSNNNHPIKRVKNEKSYKELNNELPEATTKIILSHHNGELINNQSDQLNNKLSHIHNQHSHQQIADQQNVNHGEQFDCISDSNSAINTDDSLPYFQNDSFNQEICDKLRWKLKYYFMNPIEKWKAKKKFPWKLILQIIKIIFVTIHVLTYGSSMARFLNHQGNMLISLRELLLDNWDTAREVATYPPNPPYAVYTKEEFYSNFDFAVKSFAKITKDATGCFGYSTNDTNEVSPIKVCFKNYVNGSMNPEQFFYDYNNAVKKQCYNLEPLGPAGSSEWEKFSFKNYLNNRSINLDFNRLIQVTLKFQLRTIYLNNLESGSYPECYDVHIKINYDNSQHCGQIVINLKAASFLRECNGILVLILCTISFTLCTRSLIKSHKLGLETKEFFEHHFRRHLVMEDRMEFYDFWIIMIILNDVFIIIGTILLQFQHTSNVTNFDYTTCTLFLGVGIFLVWTGILRYLSFFKKYNVVILTAKKAYPEIFRFLICVLLLYCAFCLCGWIVLGPYHLKFRTLSRTSECLFSLLNGDDMFATFATTESNNPTIWIFSRIYLYGFITIFIYIILSLFISIIMDAYETIKECYIIGIPMSDLHKFISECSDNPPNLNQNRHQNSGFSFRNCLRSCCHCLDNSSYECL